jgi:hypothetical protein
LNPMGVFISRGPEVQETPLAPVFRLYRPAFPGGVQPLHIECLELAEGLAAVDAMALSNEAGHWLFAANASPDQEAAIHLQGLPAYQQGEALMGEGLRAGWREEPVEVGREPIMLPPQSLLRLHGQPRQGSKARRILSQ